MTITISHGSLDSSPHKGHSAAAGGPFGGYDLDTMRAYFSAT